MNPRLTPRTTVLVLFLSAAFFSNSAHAYIDPGTGSLVFQLAAAAVFGSLVTIKLWWSKVKLLVLRLFTSSRQKKPDAD